MLTKILSLKMAKISAAPLGDKTNLCKSRPQQNSSKAEEGLPDLTESLVNQGKVWHHANNLPPKKTSPQQKPQTHKKEDSRVALKAKAKISTKGLARLKPRCKLEQLEELAR